MPKTGGTAIEQLLDIRQLYDSNPKRRPTPQHFTAAMLRTHLGETKWSSYYSFAFVRNPWARLLSSYFWRQTLKIKRPVLAFDKFVEHASNCVAAERYYEEDFGDHFIPQVAFTDGVDEVFRYEAFAEGVEFVAKRLGQKPPVVPPKEVKAHDDYRAYFSSAARDCVAETYAQDIASYEYRF